MKQQIHLNECDAQQRCKESQLSKMTALCAAVKFTVRRSDGQTGEMCDVRDSEKAWCEQSNATTTIQADRHWFSDQCEL